MTHLRVSTTSLPRPIRTTSVQQLVSRLISQRGHTSPDCQLKSAFIPEHHSSLQSFMVLIPCSKNSTAYRSNNGVNLPPHIWKPCEEKTKNLYSSLSGAHSVSWNTPLTFCLLCASLVSCFLLFAKCNMWNCLKLNTLVASLELSPHLTMWCNFVVVWWQSAFLLQNGISFHNAALSIKLRTSDESPANEINNHFHLFTCRS